MLLNRPPLTLGPGPRGVQDARRQVAEACREIDRPELVDCAELGVSELLTNALLHGEPPVSVRVRGTVRHPRIEVADASTTAPALPQASDRTDPLLTFGRGLDILARSALAWGADIESEGKVVWFSPASQLADDGGAAGIISRAPHPEPPAVTDPVTVRLDRLPLPPMVEFQHHVRELRREVRLLALAHPDHYPAARRLSAAMSDIENDACRDVEQQALASFAPGRLAADVEFTIPRSAAAAFARLLDVLDLADEFCHRHQLLTPARTPEQVAFQRWFLRELIGQAGGAEPTAFPGVS